MFWLVEQHVLDLMSSAQAGGFQAGPADLARFDSRNDSILTLDDTTAKIKIEGVLTTKPDIYAFLFGGGNTTYTDLISAIDIAESTGSIKNIDFLIDTPGGSVEGMFLAMDAIKNTTKPTRGLVTNKAASAGYGLASQADTIVANSRGDIFGSIGVLTSGYINSSRVVVTSTNAPDKSPDLATDAGRASIRERLDSIETMFIGSISEGRGVDSAKVIADFGKGGVFLADEALKRGMIDSIGDQPITKLVVKDNKTKPKVLTMDIAQFEAEFPAVYKQTLAIGQDQGKKEEFARVEAHLQFGKDFTAMDIAIGAITDNKASNDMKLMSQYLSAGRNNNDLAASAADGNSVDPGTVAAPSADDIASKDAQAASNILAMTREMLGIESEVSSNV